MIRTVQLRAAVGLAIAVGVCAGLWSQVASAQRPTRAAAQRPAAAPVAAPAPAPALSPELKAFADQCEGLRRGTILRLEGTLRGLKSGHVVTPDNPGTIRQTQADLEELRSGRRLVIPMLRFPTRVGEIGRLPAGGVYVEQILGPKEALVRCSFKLNVVVTRDRQTVGEIVRQRPMFKMSGQSTADWSESADVPLDGAFQIAGTERYKTEAGRWTTVQVIKPFDMRPIEEYLKRQEAN